MSRTDGTGAPLPGGFTGLDRRRVWSAGLLVAAGLAALVLARESVRDVDD